MQNMTREEKIEERRRRGQEKIKNIMERANSGDFLFTCTEGVVDSVKKTYGDVRAEPAVYTGSLPVCERIPMFNLYKI